GTVSPPSSPVAGPIAEVFKLLDSLLENARSGMTAIMLSNEMAQTRDMIVKVYKWHPALFELASFARQLKNYPERARLDPDTLTELSAKIEDWKKRIAS
ncbi:MAG: hypothetical protein ACFFD2_30140, partial [Promethearchaeota archaeon]